MYAANTLLKAGKTVLVVEAADYVGGRTRQLEGFVDWRIDLGGEMIHGKNTLLDKIAQAEGWDKREVFFSFPQPDETFKPNDPKGTEWFWIGRDAKMVPYSTDDPDVRKMVKVFRQMFSGPDITPNVSVYEYLVANGVPQRVIGIADALWGKVYGSQLDLVGVNEARNEEHNTVAEEGFEFNYRVRTSFYDLVKYLKAPLDIRTNWQVKSIETGSDGVVTLTNAKGQSVTAKRVIVAVPLPILQDGDIKFTPALPKEKTDALSRMGMEPGTKVILKFSQRFWPENVELVICGDSFVPEIWIDGGAYRGPNAPWTITGFCVGDAARNIGKLDDKAVTRLFQAQLNQMFGTNQDLSPASRYCLGSTIFRWADQPFVRGGYSYPRLGSLGDRERLAKPVDNKIFFSGEATSYTCESGTINAAMVTGQRAAEQAIASFTPKAKL
jgi:lysine-specific histone demethylase 1B